jgi:hypothetical protein
LVNKQEPRILFSSLVSDSVSHRHSSIHKGLGNRPRGIPNFILYVCNALLGSRSVSFSSDFILKAVIPAFRLRMYVGRDLPLGCRSKAFRFYSTYSMHRLNKSMEKIFTYLYLYYICPVLLLGQSHMIFSLQNFFYESSYSLIPVPLT